PCAAADQAAAESRGWGTNRNSCWPGGRRANFARCGRTEDSEGNAGRVAAYAVESQNKSDKEAHAVSSSCNRLRQRASRPAHVCRDGLPSSRFRLEFAACPAHGEVSVHTGAGPGTLRPERRPAGLSQFCPDSSRSRRHALIPIGSVPAEEQPIAGGTGEA